MARPTPSERHAATMLIEQHADVNVLSDEGQSPLIVATANRHAAVAKLLRDHGANEDHRWMGLAAEDMRGRQVAAPRLQAGRARR